MRPLADRESAAGQAAEQVEELLDRASEAAKNGDEARAREATDQAVGAMESARKDVSMLGEALASSQADQAERTERLERGLSTLPQAETESGRSAAEALARAAQAMQSASESARRNEASSARSSAAEAQSALESARQALEGAREEAASAQAEAAGALADQEAEMAREAESLDELVPQASMNAEAQGEVAEALENARQAMERAEAELREGRSATAAGSQREAVQEMRRARQTASEGVTPSSSQDRARQEELVREQEEIREELLDLARRIKERDNARPIPDMERAASAAQEATQALEEGSLSEAEEKEREVEQELRQTQDRLQEEEDQYQSLREEEQLFRIAEDMQSLIEVHRAQMAELIELDAQRRPDAAPSRAQRLRIRRIAREEESIAGRAVEMSTAIVEEGALVSGQLLRNVSDDLERITEALSDRGDYETGPRTQALQRDVEESMVWLLEALREEQVRRQQEQQQEQGQNQEQDQGENQEGLIPDTAELKLLRRLEVDLQESVELLIQLHPELADPDEVDDSVLREISRLALRHEKITELFSAMRERLGIEAPEEVED
jgi:hypothetical protein